MEIDAPRTGKADMIMSDSWARLVGIDGLMSNVVQHIVSKTESTETYALRCSANRNVVRPVHSRSHMDPLD